ncbi:hypothetical protein ACEQ8H_005865 [Pleosporales sp. CAS-2024a]
MRGSLFFSLPLVGAALAQSSGKFTTITFNVAGLPPILNGNDVPGDKTDNTARIGQLLTQYNISLIHVQEDFNFHATLYANDQHPYRTPTSGGVPFGSGLNSLGNFPYTAFERIKWATCSTIDGADCLTPKGFTFMRVQVAPGVSFDAYNLHADAGTTAADLVARAANLRQVSDYVTANSQGNAVIIFGDTNSRYTRGPDDIPGIFAQKNGMKDVWIELVKNGIAPVGGSDALLCDNPSDTTACETVDKVFYRASPAFSLQATSFTYAGDMFLQTNGSILSDHDPVLVEFAWSLNSNLAVSNTFGGEFGTWFSDAPSVPSGAAARTVVLSGDKRLDAVSMTLASGQTFTHGGSGGTATSLTLNSGEKLTGATLCRGNKDNDTSKTRVFYAELTTSAGRSVKTGVQTSDCTTLTAPTGKAIVGYLGRSGDEVDMLGFVYA